MKLFSTFALLAFLTGATCANDPLSPEMSRHEVVVERGKPRYPPGKCKNESGYTVVVTPSSLPSLHTTNNTSDTLTASVTSCGEEVPFVTMTWTVLNTAVVEAISSTAKTVPVNAVDAGTTSIIATTDGGGADTVIATVGGPLIAGCPTDGFLAQVPVANISGLTAALAAAVPGDQIELAAGTYAFTSDLVITADGTESNPIILCGTNAAILTGGDPLDGNPDRAFKPNGDWWVFKSFQIEGGFWGIYSEGGSHNVYDDLEIHGMRQEAVHLRLTAKHNELKNLYIHDTGIADPVHGECIYLGSGANGQERADSNWVHHNRIGPCTQEGIEFKEGTTGNLAEFNTLGPCGTNNNIGSEGCIILRGDSSTAQFNHIVGPTPRYSMYIYPDCGSDGISGTCFTTGKGNVVEGNVMENMGSAYAGIQVRATANQATNKVYCPPSNTVPAGHNLIAGGLSCTQGGQLPPEE